MISFLRKIRKSALRENRFSRYLLYAIGEIALVVVGILIALQINTWNEQRKNRDAEEEYLTAIAEDLRSDIASNENIIEMARNRKTAIENILHVLNNDSTFEELN